MTFCNKSIENERLLLRKLTLNDASDIYEYASDVEVSKFTTWEKHRSIDDTYTFLNMVLQKYENEQPSDWAIVHKDTNQVIGTCGWVYLNEVHHRAEIGYALSRKYWNQGLITDVVRTILNFGFNELDLNRIEARCIAENVGSERVMQKVGMHYEGLIREQMFVKGRYVDLKLYGILKSDG
ncbi:GNAT family N-acetyltransferase [Paenibacillus sp. 5J-6]|uniref:GNAT family N-acetyltransferase n=1 Tax=Paenibacillus silvestris TaxID=2606219 RepID=A0A6L8UT66_9BACL|nr:GNAT family N-acetyltransferase [Paenibacillus silvestris]MZQ81315.1 GNAT family N-acetyltransferase [Paenibacillus silvestris]